jgi:cobalamin synthase
MFKDYFKQGFSDVWGMLWDIPGPEPTGKNKKLDPDQLNRFILMLFPGFGLMAGLFSLAVAWLCSRLPGATAAAILFAIATIILHEVLTGGRNLSSLSSCIDTVSRKQGLLRGLFTMNEDIHAARGTVGMLALFGLLVLRAVCLALLFSSSFWSWLPVAFILAYGLQAHLATLPSLSSGHEIIRSDDNQVWTMWIVAGIAAIIIAKGHFSCTLAAILLTCFIGTLLKRFFQMKTEGITGSIVGAIGYAAETVLLLYGVAFANV